MSRVIRPALAILARSMPGRFVVESLCRAVNACSLCGATVEHDDSGPCCDGAEVVPVEVWSPAVAMGLLDGSRRGLALRGAVRP